MVLKLCNIPVYLGVFLIGMMTAPFAGMVLPLLFLFDVSLLLPSSMYGLSGILRARREGCLSVRAAVSYTHLGRGALHLPVGAGLPAELSRNSGLSERTAQAPRRIGVHRDGDRARSRGHPVAAAAGRPGRSDHGL